MRERINRLAKGMIDAEIPEIVVLPESLDFTVTAGQVSRKELYVADRYGCFVKGLVYSSNPCVRVLGNSFGGNRNRIFYEIDCTTLSDGDKIEGTFDLVTNGGEKKLPYSFVVEPDSVGKLLLGLENPEEFAKLVQYDGEFAKRLFEYRDFTEAPFMQNLHTRALYDGLKGRPNRQNALEEFLIALGAKKAVELSANTSVRNFEKTETSVEPVIQVQRSTWGYVRFEVRADGEFIEIPQKVFTSDDFTEDVCQVPYRINRAGLHQGKNLGAVWIVSLRQKLCIPVEVQVGDEEKIRAGYGRKEAFGKYLELRLEYELGLYGEALMQNQLKQQLEVIKGQFGESLAVKLCEADVACLEGDTQEAEKLLSACQDEVLAVKKYSPEYERFYRYLEEKSSGNKKEQEQTPQEQFSELSQEFSKGSRSPYLYAQAWKLFEKDLTLFTDLHEFELQILMFAIKRKLITQDIALRAAELAKTKKRVGHLLFHMFVKLYEQFPELEILNAVCSILIKADCRDKKYFTWYEKALKEGVNLTRLYEYYLYALPEDYPYLLPKEVLLYFSYEKSMDAGNREVLYSNIVRYMSPESSLYQQYERDIEQFAMDQLLHSRVNSRLMVLYQHVLYKEMIDEQVAKILPAILKSYRILITNEKIRYVVVCYEELEREDVYAVRDGVAYVPLYSGHPVLLFEDEFGNRYTDISCRRQQAMMGGNRRELEDRCYEISPDQPMFLLEHCSSIVRSGIHDGVDRRILKRVLTELKLHPLFRKKLLECLICYDSKTQKADTNIKFMDTSDYLTKVNPEALSRTERAKLIQLLIIQGHSAEAFDLIRTYGWSGVDSRECLKLCSYMILKQIQNEDATLLALSWKLFEEGLTEDAVLDYLCEYFNGTSQQMYELLEKSQKEQIELYDLPERLLAQMMFSGETDNLDRVFAYYREEKHVSQQVVKAYFTMKSADYFLKNRKTDDAVFSYLEEAVQDAAEKRRVPTIYLLALTFWYSRQESLSEQQKVLCRSMVDELMEEGRIFAYFHQLGRLIPMPDSIMDQITIEYRGSRESRPELKIRVLPKEESSRSAEFTKVYPGIYVHQHVLFDGEILEYEVYEDGPDGKQRMEEGRLSCDDNVYGSPVSRFAALNDMSRLLMEGDGQKLKEKMEKYLTDHAAMEALFTLM